MRGTIRRFLVVACVVSAFAFGSAAVAAELRLIDASGLVRAIKVVKSNARVVIKISSSTGAISGECVATNVDGLASERRAPISADGECEFKDMTGGSWQITTPAASKWRAVVYE